MATNTIKTRIQLKCDTEVNWNKSALVADGGTKQSGTTFIPKQGEVIIYSADGTHPFSRFKVGDGIHSVPQLPFIDASTVNGKTVLSNVPENANFNDTIVEVIRMITSIEGTSTVPNGTLGNVVYLSEDQLKNLFKNGSINSNGNTIYYSDNDLYITPSNDEAIIKEQRSQFPAIGVEGVLYIDASNYQVYKWTPNGGYSIEYQLKKTNVSNITNWNPGTMTNLIVGINEPTLIVSNGTIPTLNYDTISVFNDLGK